MAGTLKVIPLPTGEQNPDSLGFQLIKDVPVTAGDRVFADVVGRDLLLIRRILSRYDKAYSVKADFRESFFLLISAARAGVEHPHGDLALGEIALQSARENILGSIGRRVRNQFISRLSVITMAICIIAGFLIIFSTLPSVQAILKIDGSDLSPLLKAFSVAAIGNVLSIWMVSVLHLRNLRWEKLDYLDPDGFPPGLRIALVLVLTVILLGLLDNRIIILGLGNTELNQFREGMGVAFMIGVLCGASEVPVATLVLDVFRRPHMQTSGPMQQGKPSAGDPASSS